MREQQNGFADFFKLQRSEMQRLEEAYKNAVAWLLFSAAMNAAFIASWMWEVAR